MRRLSSFLILAAAAVITAKADIVVNHIGGPTPVGPFYQWDYSAQLENHPLVSGDFFAIFDFFGFVGEAAPPPSDWALTVEPTTTQTLTAAPDNESYTNLKWTYSGPTIDTSFTWSNFSVLSTGGGTVLSELYYIGQTDGGNAANLGPTVNGPSEVPEPGTIALLGGGMGLLVLMKRRRTA